VGTKGYIGCDSTDHRGLIVRAVTLIGILPCLGEGEGLGFVFYTLMEA
jgi:hypothetical protein